MFRGYPSPIKPTLNEEEHQWHALQVRCFWGEDFSSTLQRPRFQVVVGIGWDRKLFSKKGFQTTFQNQYSVFGNDLQKENCRLQMVFHTNLSLLNLRWVISRISTTSTLGTIPPPAMRLLNNENIWSCFVYVLQGSLLTKNMLVEMRIHFIHISYISTDLKITAVSWSVPVWNQESKMSITLGFFQREGGIFIKWSSDS